MENLVTISKAAKIFGVSEATLRKWDKDGKLVAIKTEGGHRRYDIGEIKPETVHRFGFEDSRKTVAYVSVSSRDKKEDSERQKQILKMFCSKNGWTFEVISDIGSGIDYHKKGLISLLNAILDDRVGRLVLTHKDRLLRFGAELVFSICEAKHVEVVIINKGDDTAFEEDLATDILDIATVFSARLYGSRSETIKKLLDNLIKALGESPNARGA
jgi:excisionase family DNA binding protein